MQNVIARKGTHSATVKDSEKAALAHKANPQRADEKRGCVYPRVTSENVDWPAGDSIRPAPSRTITKTTVAKRQHATPKPTTSFTGSHVPRFQFLEIPAAIAGAPPSCATARLKGLTLGHALSCTSCSTAFTQMSFPVRR